MELSTTSELFLVSCLLGGSKSCPGAREWLRSCPRAGLSSQEGLLSCSISPGWLPAVTSPGNGVVNCLWTNIMLENLHLPLERVRFHQQGARAALLAPGRGRSRGIRDAGAPAAGLSARVLNLAASSCEGNSPCGVFALGTRAASPRKRSGAQREM